MAFAGVWKPCIWQSVYWSRSKVLSLKHNCALQVSAGHRWGLESFLCSSLWFLLRLILIPGFVQRAIFKKGKAMHAFLSWNWTKCQLPFGWQLEQYLLCRYGKRNGRWGEAGWHFRRKLSQCAHLWWHLIQPSQLTTKSRVCFKTKISSTLPLFLMSALHMCWLTPWLPHMRTNTSTWNECNNGMRLHDLYIMRWPWFDLHPSCVCQFSYSV